MTVRRRLHERWWHLVTALLGVVMMCCASAIEGDNVDLLVGTDPTLGDDGTGFWLVLLAAGLLLAVGSVVMLLRPDRGPVARRSRRG